MKHNLAHESFHRASTKLLILLPPGVFKYDGRAAELQRAVPRPKPEFVRLKLINVHYNPLRLGDGIHNNYCVRVAVRILCYDTFS